MGKGQEYKFRTEAKELLDLMVHSVYSNKDIFLRELISNASDAIDKLRFEALANRELEKDLESPLIRIAADSERRTVAVQDNGIGMSREELREFIGVIAKSGSREYAKAVEAAGKGSLPPELIGQFGVGFYSCFMVAGKVTIHTRKAGEGEGWLWSSTGDGTYMIADEPREKAGTTVTVELKEADPEAGLKDYSDPWVIRDIVKKYSDFVAHPIVMEVEHVELERDAEGKVKTEVPPTTSRQDETLNSMKAIWTRPEKDVTDQEYNEFYRHISKDWAEPLERFTSQAEGTAEFRMLLYVPSQAPFDMFVPGAPHGVHLYIRRVFIMNDCREILPLYLRFIKGVVDSEDLPLNISREILQQDRGVKTIRTHLVRKTLKTLETMKGEKPDKYKTFWDAFGKVLKEGLLQDQKNREEILKLCTFDSTRSPVEKTDLAQYVARMKEGQEAIYYLTGRSRQAMEQSPHLEALREKGYEVLLLSDPVDEVWTQMITEHAGKPLRSVGKGTVDLPAEGEKDKSEGEAGQRAEKADGQAAAAPGKDLLELLKGKLAEHVKEVRLSARLTTSPACLVGDEADLTPQLEQMLRASGQEVPKVKRILELNPKHPLVTGLQALLAGNPDDPRLALFAELLHGQALLAEGGTLPDPAAFSRRLAELMLDNLK
jgi:molecular chaperone HtpG